MALMYCNHCGGQISDKALRCPHCGAPGPAAQTAAPAAAAPAPAAGDPAPAGSAAPAKTGSKAPLIIAVAALAVVGIVLAVILLFKDSGPAKAGNNGSPVNSTLVFDKSQSAQGGGQSAQEKNVTFKIKVEKNTIAAKYLVEFYIDDEFIATVDDDNDYEMTFRMVQGIHTITFKNNKDPDNDVYTLTLNETVSDDMTVSYTLKRNTAIGGLFDRIKGIELRDRKYS